jgi:SlyX protein
MTENVVELQQKLIDLESKLAFQDDMVQTLNDELHEHQKSIEKLQRQVMLLAEKISKGNDSGILRVDEEPPPPHY